MFTYELIRVQYMNYFMRIQLGLLLCVSTDSMSIFSHSNILTATKKINDKCIIIKLMTSVLLLN